MSIDENLYCPIFYFVERTTVRTVLGMLCIEQIIDKH